MKYRCKVDLAAEVLSACLNAQKKTRIMNHSNLNSKQLYVYLNLLLGSDMLSFDATVDSYSITEKGRQFLGLFDVYRKLFAESEHKLAMVKERKLQLEQMCTPADKSPAN